MKTLHNTSHVYIIREDNKRSKNYFKIGSSKTSQRLSGCQVGNPRNLFLLKTTEHQNAQKLEFFLHENLSKFHIRGEWFRANQDELLTEVNILQTKFENLNNNDIKKIKRQFSAFSDVKMAKKASKASILKRRCLAKEWAEQSGILDEIKQAKALLRKPTLESVCFFLNSKGLVTRTGKSFTPGNLQQQIVRLGFDNLKCV